MSLKQVNEKTNTSQQLQQQQHELTCSTTMNSFKPQQMPFQPILKRHDYYDEQLAMREIAPNVLPESTSSINSFSKESSFNNSVLMSKKKDSTSSKNNYLEGTISIDKSEFDNVNIETIDGFYLKFITVA